MCSFLSTGLLPPWLGLFLGTLFFLLLYQMGFFSWYLFLQFRCWSTGMPLISEYWLCIWLLCQIQLLVRVDFLVESFRFSVYTVMSSANSDSFISSFPIWCLLFLFLLLLLWPGLPVLCWIGVVREGILVLFLILVGSSKFLFIEYDVGYRSLIYGLYYVEVCSRYSHFVEGFIINGCCTLSNAFSASIDMIKWFLSLLLFMCTHLVICSTALKRRNTLIPYRTNYDDKKNKIATLGI